MKKISALFICLLVMVNNLNSQNTLSPAMINTAGGSGLANSIYFDYTVGEPYIAYGGTSCDSIFSGFQHLAIDTFEVRKATAIANSTTTFCQSGNVLLSAPAGASYMWSNGATTQNITVTSSGTYSVKVFNSCGDSLSSNLISVDVLEPTVPQICMVTVDDPGNNNLIIWDKTSHLDADTFVVYREITSNNYQIIGKVPFDSLSQFVDTIRTQYFPNTGNPNFGTFRYKMAVIDTCGNTGQKSNYHNTIWMQDLGGGAFQWSAYLIEGQTPPVVGLSAYNLMRDNIADGNYVVANSVAGSQLNMGDPSFAPFQFTADWRIETDWTIACEPTLRLANGNNEIQTQVVRSKSNIKNQRAIGIKSDINNLKSKIRIYPNPANEILNLEFLILNGAQATITIENMLGQVVYSQQTNKPINSINTSLFETGVYFVKVNTGKGIVVEKVIIE